MTTLMANRNDPLRISPLEISGAAEDTAADITIPHGEQAKIIVRPDGIGKLWVEREYDDLEAEQTPLWDAAGEVATRDARQDAARAALGATEDTYIVTAHRARIDDALTRARRTHQFLDSYRRRPSKAKRWYQAGKCGLLLGDIAGFGTAAIWLGEMPAIALSLATSAAVATIAAGLIGSDVRDREQRRQRAEAAPEQTDDLKEYRHLFAPHTGGVLKHMLTVAAATAGTIGVGIAALRGAVDDPLIGLIFGGIALAIAGGSFLLSYAGADEVADLIDQADADYDKAVAAHQKLAASDSASTHAASVAEADSLTREHAARGKAASAHIRALKWGILRRNPSHAGHGSTPAVSALRPLAAAQTARREEEKAA